MVKYEAYKRLEEEQLSEKRMVEWSKNYKKKKVRKVDKRKKKKDIQFKIDDILELYEDYIKDGVNVSEWKPKSRNKHNKQIKQTNIPNKHNKQTNKANKHNKQT
jgi:hypothetical protein